MKVAIFSWMSRMTRSDVKKRSPAARERSCSRTI